MADPHTADVINDWVSRQTAGKITQAVRTEDLAGPPPTEALLVNAIYFKALWENPFRRENTKSDAFQLADGDWVPRLFMHQASREFGYLRGESWTAVCLDYTGHHPMYMSFFVPDTATGLPDFVAALTIGKWQRWQSQLRESINEFEVDLVLPPFKMS